MSVPAIAAWAAASVAVVGGAVGGGMILLTSGPLASQDSDPGPGNGPAFSLASPVATVTLAPPGTPDTSTRLVSSTEEIDLATLPPPDMTAWATHESESGVIRLRAPRDWHFETYVVHGIDGAVIGEQANLRAPYTGEPEIGRANDGFVRLYVSLLPFAVPIDYGDAESSSARALDRAELPAWAVTGDADGLAITRTVGSHQFADVKGVLWLESPPVQLVDSGLVLQAFATLEYDLPPMLVSEAVAVLGSLEVVQ